jgi:hypothetical protein
MVDCKKEGEVYWLAFNKLEGFQDNGERMFEYLNLKKGIALMDMK